MTSEASSSSSHHKQMHQHHIDDKITNSHHHHLLPAGYRIRPATEQDVDFLAQAIQDSERAHTGIGIWDVAIGDDIINPNRSLVAILRHGCLYDRQSHFHYSHFLVIVTTTATTTTTTCGQERAGEEGEEGGGSNAGDKGGDGSERKEEVIVGAGCCFLYPHFCVVKSYPGISLATRLLRPDITYEESIAMWQKIDIFLDEIFPSYQYEHTWMLESIIIHPQHRQKGLAVALIHALYSQGYGHLEDGTSAKECLAVCAIGNDPAYQTYLKAGFECIGKGTNDIAEKALGYPGFYLFRKHYHR